MPNAQRRIEDKLPTGPLKWPNADAELEGCDVDSYELLYRHFRVRAAEMGYPSINAALDACAPFVSHGEEVAPQVPNGHWLPQRDPADEAVKLSKVLRQYPQLAEVMGREMLLMRCVREALCVEADPDVAHALQYAYFRDVLGGAPAEQASEEVLALHRQLAAEKLRADQGWQRAESKAKECAELRERLAEQASKQVPTIDTPEFQAILKAYRNSTIDFAERKAELIAHIDAELSGQPAAPVAATEQATIDTPEFRNLLTGIYGIDTSGENYKGLVAFINAARAPLATPADAGAGLTEEIRIARHAVCNLNEFRAGRTTFPGEALGILENCLDRLARLSTPAAPVTASQPAAQVPSIDRDSVLEEAAKACEAWGMAKVRAWADDEEMSDDAKARAWDASVCASTIRALKGKPAAAHAAKEGGQQ